MADYLDQLVEKAKKKGQQATQTPTSAPKLEQALHGKQATEQQIVQKLEELKMPQVPASSRIHWVIQGKQEQELPPAPKEKTKKSVVTSYGETTVFRVEGSELLHYEVPVPKPTSAEKAVINAIKEAATRLISISPYRVRDPQQKRNVYYQRILEILKNNPELNIPPNRFDFYAKAVVREMVGYGIIDPLINDDLLEEIMVIGSKKPVYVFHREFEMMTTNIEFYNDEEIQDLVNRIAREVGRRVDISSPLLDARLPDGSRVNATIPPASVDDSSLTIRKFRKDPYSLVDLVVLKTINLETAAFLWLCVEGLGTKPANILISGGTGSGKTTTLNSLAALIPERERIVTIEDTAELALPLEHWIRMEARPPGMEGTGELTMDILTKNALRMRPDRIIVGEVRHAEAFTLFTALNTGHDGCLTGKTKIPLTSGITEIGLFADAWLSQGASWKEGDWDVCNVEGEFVNSLDDNGKIFRSSICQVRRRPFEGMIHHIRLASGSEITCTGNHPFYALKNEVLQIKAEQLSEGQFVATPSRLERDSTASEAETEYWSGLLHGDGNILNKNRVRTKNGKQYICHEGRVSLYTEEPSIVPAFVQFMQNHFDHPYVRTVNPRPIKNCYELHTSSIETTKKVMARLDIPAGSRQKVSMSNSHYQNDLRAFVSGFFDAEGYVDLENNALVFTNANEEYIDFFRYALLTEGIRSRKYESNTANSRWYRLYVYGIDQVAKFANRYPIRFPEKKKKLAALLNKKAKPNTNVDVVPCTDQIIELLAKAKQKGFSQQKIADKAGLSQGLLNFYVHQQRMPSKDTLSRLSNAFESIGLNASALGQLANAEIFWDRIIAIHSYPYAGFVYDLTLNETKESGTKPHNFVANGIIVGNSLGTLHANSPEETIVRVTNPPMNVPSTMLAALDLIIVENRLHDKHRGTIRRVTEIAQVQGALENKLTTRNIFSWNPLKDSLERTAQEIDYIKKLQKFTGLEPKQLELEWKRRERFLEDLLKKNTRNIQSVRQETNRFLEAK